MGRSRHKRHLKVLESLTRSGWKVEACYHGHLGFSGDINRMRRQVFWPFNSTWPHNGDLFRFKRPFYCTPPYLMGCGKATFILVRTVHATRPIFMRINGWKDLSAFAVHELQAKKGEAR